MKSVHSTEARPPTRSNWLYRSLAILSLCSALFALVPLAFSMISSGGRALEQLPYLSDWRVPTFRSLCLMVTCAPLCILAGFILGSRLADVRRSIGLWAGLL